MKPQESNSERGPADPAFTARVREFMDRALHPTLGRRLSSLTYLPK